MAANVTDREADRIRRVCRLLYDASKTIRVLKSVDWPPATKAQFFAEGGRELPRVDYRLLFCGKLDVMDIPALSELYAMGLLQPPRHLPPWIADPRYLLALLTYSTFLNRMEPEPMQQAAERLLADAPVVSL